MVHSALERAPLPLGVEGPLELLHAAGQLVEARVVDDQDAVEVVELVLEGLGLGLGLGLGSGLGLGLGSGLGLGLPDSSFSVRRARR